MLTFRQSTQCQNAALPLQPVITPQLHLQQLKQHAWQIWPKPDCEDIQCPCGALAQISLRRHLLHKLVGVQVVIVVLVPLIQLLPIGADLLATSVVPISIVLQKTCHCNDAA